MTFDLNIWCCICCPAWMKPRAGFIVTGGVGGTPGGTAVALGGGCSCWDCMDVGYAWRYIPSSYVTCM